MRRAATFFYRLYDLGVKSALPLCGTEDAFRCADIEILDGRPRFFSRLRDSLPPNGQVPPFLYHTFEDNSDYIRFFDLLEFWVSPTGRKVVCRQMKRPAPVQTTGKPELSGLNYLQTNVLSFALLKMGLEPLHATAVVVDDAAIGWAGEGGTGKSTLAAHFLSAGFPLLTDDLLVLRNRGGGFYASQGAPRMKLFPEMAARLLGDSAVGIPMNPATRKRVFPIEGARACNRSVPLKALYLLQPPTRRERPSPIVIQRIQGQKACMALIRSAYNLVIQRADRLRNLFSFAAALAEAIPIYTLDYPRDLGKLPKVREAILSHLRNSFP